MVSPLRPETWHGVNIGHKANGKVAQPPHGFHDQVGVPQVALLGHGEALET